MHYFTSARSIIAESFRDIEWEEHSWGYVFSWPNFIEVDANYSMLNQEHIDTQLIKDRISWVLDDPARKLLTNTQEDLQQPGLASTSQFFLLARTPGNLTSLVLNEFGIKKYSYSTKDASINILNQVSLLSEIMEIPDKSRSQFDRYNQAFLHLHNGTIWQLVDEDDNVYAIALTSELDDFEFGSKPLKVQYIEFIATRKKLRGQGFGKTLLQTILAKNKKHTTLAKGTTENVQFFASVGFKECHRFNIWIKQ
jgi:GNAT superfamily N-acetyltransferase